MATFALGDVHGRYGALRQVLTRSGLNKQTDTLIFLGDVVDRGDSPFLCIQELLTIENLIVIRGNHDENFLSYIRSGHDGFAGEYGVDVSKQVWGGLNSVERQMVQYFLQLGRPYYIDGKNRMFTHGGFDRMEAVEQQLPRVFAWDRKLLKQAMSCRDGQTLMTVDGFSEIYVGHTTSLSWGQTTPLIKGGVYGIDTAAGQETGKLTIMDVETHDYFQSDVIADIPVTDEELWDSYQRGWHHCFDNVDFAPEEPQKRRAYRIGWDDYIIGDDVCSNDLKTKEEILEEIKKRLSST
jgi:serine/threonine protein phosphatase 1